MKTSTTIAAIAKALAAAQGEIKNPETNETVDVHAKKSEGGALLYSYDYATLPKCYDAARSPFAKNGISHTSGISPTERGLLLSVRLNHESGEWYESDMPLPGNLASKDLAGSVTFWKRYLFNGLAGIAGDSDLKSEDGDRGPIVEPARGGGQRQNAPRGGQNAQGGSLPAPATPTAQAEEMANLGQLIKAKMAEKSWTAAQANLFCKTKYKAENANQMKLGQLKSFLKDLETEKPPYIDEPPPEVNLDPAANKT